MVYDYKSWIHYIILIFEIKHHISKHSKFEWVERMTKFTTLVKYVKWRIIKEIRKRARSKSHYNENDNWLKGLLNYKTRVKVLKVIWDPYIWKSKSFLGLNHFELSISKLWQNTKKESHLDYKLREDIFWLVDLPWE